MGIYLFFNVKIHIFVSRMTKYFSVEDRRNEFISRARKKFGDKYDLSGVNYVNNKTKVNVICPEHGLFQIRPAAFINGHGCPKCASKIAGVKRGKKQRMTRDAFIKKAKAIHGDKYDYSKVIYNGANEKIRIICPEHGEFLQRPGNHLNGDGCPKCANKRKSINKTKSTEDFIEEARAIHGNKYDYSKVKYNGAHEKVCIICPEHGEFWQTPHNHLKGHGCPFCANKFKTTMDFVSAASIIHDGKYDYSKVEYKDAHTKVCIICPKHGEFWQTPFNHINDHGCPKCVRQISKWEQEVYDFIVSLGISAEHSNREILEGREIDIYLPEERIGIECDGLRWHNETHKPKNYHLEKTKACEEKGVRLIHIFEDEWVHNSEIWKSMLRNMFGETENRIYARNCEVREVNAREKRRFLKHNHIQGNAQSRYNYGLFHDGELVSLMTFGNPRINMGGRKKEGSYELVRFCNKINTNVVGGAGKLFSHFVKGHNPSEIVSYSDKRWATGKLYTILGFENVHDSRPNYFYVNNLTRENRFKYRKSVLVNEGYDKDKTEHQIMFERGIYRIYDCGTKVWKWKK